MHATAGVALARMLWVVQMIRGCDLRVGMSATSAREPQSDRVRLETAARVTSREPLRPSPITPLSARRLHSFVLSSSSPATSLDEGSGWELRRSSSSLILNFILRVLM